MYSILSGATQQENTKIIPKIVILDESTSEKHFSKLYNDTSYYSSGSQFSVTASIIAFFTIGRKSANREGQLNCEAA